MKNLHRPPTFNAVTLSARIHKQKLLAVFETVLHRGIFINGPENRKLEHLLEPKLPGGLVTTVASGHDALLFALAALHLKPTDEVIFPVNAYPTAFPVALAGVTPVPVDVDHNGQLDSSALEKSITKQTKVVIAVHLYGLVGEIGEIGKICKRHGLILIEDCAQAFGSMYREKPVGTLGNIGCFSFYPTKNLGALGDGGALWTRKKQWHNFFLAAKAYGETQRYMSRFVSGHSRLPELQAAALTVYLSSFDREVARRTRVRTLYEKELRSANLGRWVRLLTSSPHSDPVTHLLVIEADRRDNLAQFLKSRDIETLIHYPYPVHLVHAFRSLGYRRGDFPIAERLAHGVVSLPFHPHITRTEVTTVVQSIRDFYHG